MVERFGLQRRAHGVSKSAAALKNRIEKQGSVQLVQTAPGDAVGCTIDANPDGKRKSWLSRFGESL
jgi:hypothetical protein